MLGKMAQDVDMMQKYCVSFLPCLVASWEFHPYMHMLVFENFLALLVSFFHAVIVKHAETLLVWTT